MGYPSIGSYSVELAQIPLANPANAVERIEVPGSHGAIFRRIGYRAQPATIVTESYHASASNARTFFANLQALQGTSVTVTDANSTTWSSVKILDVRMTENINKVVNFTGGTNTSAGTAYRLRCQIDALPNYV
jgi:hypothetical protein